MPIWYISIYEQKIRWYPIGGTHMAELDLAMAMCVLLHGNRGESGNSKQWEWQLATARQDKRFLAAICTIRRRSLRRKRRVKGGAYVYVLRSRHRRQGFCEAAIRDHLSPNNYTLCTLVLLPCWQPMFLDALFCLFHCSSIWPSQHLQTVVPKQLVLTSPTVCTRATTGLCSSTTPICSKGGGWYQGV